MENANSVYKNIYYRLIEIHFYVNFTKSRWKWYDTATTQKEKQIFLFLFLHLRAKMWWCFNVKKMRKRKKYKEKEMMRRSKNSKMAEYMYVYVSRSFRVDSHLFKFWEDVTGQKRQLTRKVKSKVSKLKERIFAWQPK